MKRGCLVFFVYLSLGASAQKFFDEKALIQNLKILSADSMQGRRTGTSGRIMAADFIKTQFKKLGVQPMGNDYELPFDFEYRSEKRSGVNLAGLIKGKSESGKYIVISAHYDHAGIKNGSIYNGADDNASGVCSLLAMGEYLKANPPLHNIILVCFDAEELGLLGAKAFVQTPPVQLIDIILNLNMDMVARADKNELVACGTYYYPYLKPIVEKVKPVGLIHIRLGHDDPSLFKGSNNWTFSSDHGAFHKAKIPFIYFGVEDHADYHRPSDDFEKVNASTFISTTRLIIQSLIEFDKGLN